PDPNAAAPDAPGERPTGAVTRPALPPRIKTDPNGDKGVPADENTRPRDSVSNDRPERKQHIVEHPRDQTDTGEHPQTDTGERPQTDTGVQPEHGFRRERPAK